MLFYVHIIGKVYILKYHLFCEIKSILEMTPYLVDLKSKMDNFRQDSQPILKQKKTVFDPRTYGDLVSIDQDCEVYKKLFADTNNIELDELTIQALEIMFHASLTILERQAKDQLDGGKYRVPSENVLKSAKNIPAHNKA